MGFFQNLRTSGRLSAFDLEVPSSVIWSQPQCKNVVSLCLLTSPDGKLTICFWLHSVWLLKEVGRIACVYVCARTRKRETQKEKEGQRGKKGKGRMRKRQGRKLGFQYPGGTLPVGQWDHERGLFVLWLSWGDFILVGMKPTVLVPRSKDAGVNLHRTRSCEPAFKNLDFALADKIETITFQSPENKLDLPLEAKLEHDHRELTFKSL